MDIDYLLSLQAFRNGISDALTPFMEMISLFAVTYLVILPALLYWCVDKRVGLFTLGSYAASVTVNAVIKLSACIYRPWIRDSRVLPAGAAGAVLLFFLIETIGTPMKELLGLQWGALAQNMIIFLYILCGWPLVMKKCACHEEETGSSAYDGNAADPVR